MEILSKLFGGQARVRIMRLFLLNPEYNFEIEDIVSRSRIAKGNVRKEINILSGMNFIKTKIITKEGSRGSKKKVNSWSLNPYFEYIHPVRDILIDPKLLLEDNLIQKFKQAGKIKLLIISGVFVGESNTRVDVMMVGDKLKKNIIQQVVRNLESDIGKELDYVVFNSEEYKYRIDMYDKLVCDVLESPHDKLIDTGQLSTHISKK